MKVDTYRKNEALQTLFNNPHITVFLDANLFIPPDRTNVNALKSIPFSVYKCEFLDPIFECFSGLAIHESVYRELVAEKVKAFAESKNQENPSRLAIHTDNMLNNAELEIYKAYISKLAQHSQFEPARDNSKDRGEVLSLSYMATKNYLYFAANDNLPIRLINQSQELQTGLEEMSVLQTYEMIYYLHITGKYKSKALKGLYKYLYRLTKKEQADNPEWSEFIQQMDTLYYIEKEALYGQVV